jgi:hypothetical protein
MSKNEKEFIDELRNKLKEENQARETQTKQLFREKQSQPYSQKYEKPQPK